MSRIPAASWRTESVVSDACLSAFSTEIGWLGLLGHSQTIIGVFVGHRSLAALKTAVLRSVNEYESTNAHSIIEMDWMPQLRKDLQDYLAGQPVEFRDFPIFLPPQTSFQEKVLAATRLLTYGQTTTYGELAQIVGHPRAARAVGTVMSKNRFPILIPCHRVLAAGGKLGGYSSPMGTRLKQKLLDLERRR